MEIVELNIQKEINLIDEVKLIIDKNIEDISNFLEDKRLQEICHKYESVKKKHIEPVFNVFQIVSRYIL